ncbi:MAG: hypothetical protein ACFFFB_01860 [Candidatus Heimdallarchaeota archaeon]
MIRDVIIIKDGLPLFNKSYSISSNPTRTRNVFSQTDNLIMVSGFFTALNSFSDSFEDLGTISELKLSNNDLKLSFLKDSSIPNLIYLATYDENSKAVNVQRVLRKISSSFLNKYNINQILNWNGKINSFKSFENVLNIYITEEQEEKEQEFKEKVTELFKTVEEKINEESRLLAMQTEIEHTEDLPEYCQKIPKFTSSNKVNPKYYLTGATACNVYSEIDGKKSIQIITKRLNLEHNQVYNICKNLIKLGFISLS